MIPKKALEIVDKTLRDLCKKETMFFSGKLVIIGGDFRQILPAIKDAQKQTIISEIIKYSKI